MLIPQRMKFSSWPAIQQKLQVTRLNVFLFKCSFFLQQGYHFACFFHNPRMLSLCLHCFGNSWSDYNGLGFPLQLMLDAKSLLMWFHSKSWQTQNLSSCWTGNLSFAASVSMCVVYPDWFTDQPFLTTMTPNGLRHMGEVALSERTVSMSIWLLTKIKLSWHGSKMILPPEAFLTFKSTCCGPTRQTQHIRLEFDAKKLSLTRSASAMHAFHWCQTQEKDLIEDTPTIILAQVAKTRIVNCDNHNETCISFVKHVNDTGSFLLTCVPACVMIPLLSQPHSKQHWSDLTTS